MDDQRLDNFLLAALYRRDCPDTQMLGEYQMGLLAGPDQAHIRAHLGRCAHCRVELVQLDKFVTAPVPAAKPKRERNFEWLRLREIGQVVIRLLKESLLPAEPQLTPVAVMGDVPASEKEETEVLRRIVLGPDDTGDLDLEAVIRRSQQDPQRCTLTVRALIPGRWPDLAGTVVQARAGRWRAEGKTNDAGEVILENIPADALDTLWFQVNP